MPFWDKIFGSTSAIKDVIGAVGDTVDRFVLTKQEKLDYERLQEEQEYRLKVFEAENYQKELDRQLELYKLDNEDRANARELNKSELAQDDIFIRRFRYYLAGFWTIASIAYVGCITFINIPKDNQRFADVILGFILSGIMGTIIAYFFGSSHNSSVKDDTIKKLV